MKTLFPSFRKSSKFCLYNLGGVYWVTTYHCGAKYIRDIIAGVIYLGVLDIAVARYYQFVIRNTKLR